MNQFFKFAPAAFLLCSVALVSCSDDDKDKPDVVVPAGPSAENVFTNGVPASIDGASIKTNDKGQVTEIKSDYETVTFEYGEFTRAESFDAKMTIAYEDGDKYTAYLKLNKQGFITYALEEWSYSYNENTDTETREFEYDAEGHMISAKSEDETYSLTYTDGNLAMVKEVEHDGDWTETTFFYTDETVKTPIENKGCIMLLDDWRVDLDQLEVAYYAGLLGKATKNLPLGFNEKEHSGETYKRVFHWEFNNNGFPTKYWEDDYADYAMTFTWK